MSLLVTSSAFADQRVHGHRREYVFPDGVVLGDALDAIHAAGIAGNYLLANQLSIQYALDVCVRCARRFLDLKTQGGGEEPRTPLSDLGIMSSWGSVCPLCKLTLLATGVTVRIK